MSDMRSLSANSYNGKLIYQLTSASALKDNDLFAISTAENLTRSVSLAQIKSSFNADYYNKDDMDILLDSIRQQIKNVSDNIFASENNIAEFRNEFNNKLNQLNSDLREEINNVDKKFTDVTNDIIQQLADTKVELNNKITNLDNTLSQRITDLDTELTNMITNWIMFGTSVPTTLPTGRTYLQYF